MSKSNNSGTKAEAARINGAKSKGPVTPAGKARSSQNALRHGLTSKAVVLTNESDEDFAQFREIFYQRYRPVCDAECLFLEDMIAAAWRLRRIVRIESAAFDIALDKTIEVAEKDYKNPDNDVRLAFAFDHMVRQGTFPQLQRYASRLRLEFARAHKAFLELQATRQNEPTDPPPANPSNDFDAATPDLFEDDMPLHAPPTPYFASQRYESGTE